MPVSFIDVEEREYLIHIRLPISIGHLFLYWVSSNKLIFFLTSVGKVFIIPLAIFESEFRTPVGACRTRTLMVPFLMLAARSIYAKHSVINRGWVDPGITSRRQETFQGKNLDACGQGSNSNFSGSFVVEVLSSALDRVSHWAVQIDGMCSNGLPSAWHDVCNGESIFLSAQRVTNNLFLTDE